MSFRHNNESGNQKTIRQSKSLISCHDPFLLTISRAICTTGLTSVKNQPIMYLKAFLQKSIFNLPVLRLQYFIVFAYSQYDLPYQQQKLFLYNYSTSPVLCLQPSLFFFASSDTIDEVRFFSSGYLYCAYRLRSISLSVCRLWCCPKHAGS